MYKIMLVLVASMAIIGCHGGNNVFGGDSKVTCYSGGQLIAEYHVTDIVFRGSSGYSFDLANGMAVNVDADCIVEEIK